MSAQVASSQQSPIGRWYVRFQIEGCIARQALEANVRFQIAVERQQERVVAYAGSPQLAEAHRTARYHLHCAFAREHFGGQPQGAGARTKLADCAECTIRRLFPNPWCTPQCDLLRACEGRGHYVGFLTVQESKRRVRQLQRAGWQPLWKDDEFA